MNRRKIRANHVQLDVIRRAIKIAEAEDWLGLPKRENIANKLSQAAYTRTRESAERRRRVAMFGGGTAEHASGA